MKLTINGESRDLPDVRTLLELFAALDLKPQALLVEHNGVALHRSEWAERMVAEGDRFEFLRIAAGG